MFRDTGPGRLFLPSKKLIHTPISYPGARRVGASRPVAVRAGEVPQPVLAYGFGRRNLPTATWMDESGGFHASEGGSGGSLSLLKNLPGWNCGGGKYLSATLTRPQATMLSVWWYLDQLAVDRGAWQYIMYSSGGGGYARIFQHSSNNFLYFDSNAGPNYSNYVIPAGGWHHIALQWDSSGVPALLVIDGVSRSITGSNPVPAGLTTHRFAYLLTGKMALPRWLEGEYSADFARAFYEQERGLFQI